MTGAPPARIQPRHRGARSPRRERRRPPTTASRTQLPHALWAAVTAAHRPDSPKPRRLLPSRIAGAVCWLLERRLRRQRCPTGSGS
jgi:hypothetical protein